MRKKALISVILCLLLGMTVWSFAAGGGANDPLASLSYLTGTFTETVEKEIDKRLDASDVEILRNAETGSIVESASVWTEVRLKKNDALLGATGTNVLLLAGGCRVSYDSGTVVDATTGAEVASGSDLAANHRYIVAEDTSADFIVTSKTAVLNYQGQYAFSYSDATDYNAMATALKQLNLFKGSFTGYGQGYDLEVAPTRLQALIMFIRVLGEEEAALAWTGTTPFKDIHPGTQAFQYVGYAYEKGYTNGYTKTEFRPAGTVNAYQYTEFVLRAMGYSSAANTNLADTMERALAAGVLTEGETAMLKTDRFLRAELVYVSYHALHAYLPESSQTLADLLQEKGVFDYDAWYSVTRLVGDQRL